MSFRNSKFSFMIVLILSLLIAGSLYSQEQLGIGVGYGQPGDSFDTGSAIPGFPNPGSTPGFYVSLVNSNAVDAMGIQIIYDSNLITPQFKANPVDTVLVYPAPGPGGSPSGRAGLFIPGQPPLFPGRTVVSALQADVTAAGIDTLFFSMFAAQITPGNGPILFIPMNVSTNASPGGATALNFGTVGLNAPGDVQLDVQTFDGSFKFEAVTGVEDDGLASPELPQAFSLSHNFPNPFNPSTNINFDIPENVGDKGVNVSLKILNSRGAAIRNLISGDLKTPGSYLVHWDGTNEDGELVSSGVYFYRIVAGEFSQTKKMVLLK